MTEKTLVLAAGGTGESFPGDVRLEPSGMVRNVTDKLNRSRFDVQWVGYDASYGYPSNYEASKDSLKKRLRALTAYHRNVVFLGYSQSADAMGELALELAIEGRDPWVKALAVLGDPSRSRAHYIGKDPGGFGIRGERGGFGEYGSIPVFSAAVPGDPISGASWDSLLRNVADFTPMFTVRDPIASAQAVLDTLNANGWQNYANHWWEWPSAYRRWNTAKDEALAYMPRISLPSGFVLNPTGGKHTDYATVSPRGWTEPFTTVLANYLNNL